MPTVSSPGGSSDFYPATDEEEDAHKRDESKTDSSDGEEAQMDISGSEESSSGFDPSPEVLFAMTDSKRKRDLDTDFYLTEDNKDVSTAIERDPVNLMPRPKRPKPSSPEPSKNKPGVPQGIDAKRCLSLDTIFYGLPVSIWQNVLGFVPPVYLGRALRVSRMFHILLENNSKYTLDGFQIGEVDTEKVWRASRKRFAQGLPRTLRGQSELEMWRLLRGRGCQICAERLPLLTTSSLPSPWRTEQSQHCVRVIWPFSVRCCKDCLTAQTEQERQLLISSGFPSFLLPALPYAFVSQDQHFIPSSTIKQIDCPADIRVTKLFYRPHIQNVKAQFVAVKDLGVGSVNEWVKGLDAEEQETSLRISTWEQWENRGGLNKVNSRPGNRIVTNINPKYHESALKLKINRIASINTNSDPQTPLARTTGVVNHSPIILGISTASQSNRTANGTLPQRSAFQSVNQRHERTLQDVNETKAIRKAEIERLCAALKPPITPDLLRHMESFQAALQISLPLNERAWEDLKPRLIAQRESAEQFERGWDQQIQQVVLAKTQPDCYTHPYSKSSPKDTAEERDREAETSFTSLKDRLAHFADELIQNQWSQGRNITKENCPKFAVDVLLHVKRRFDEEYGNSHSSSAAFVDTSWGDASYNNQEQKLILEHMKWIFDNKIKGLTENFQRELFMCSGCEGNSKYYGFEAVIQHYAAKHTTALSQGSVVVHWRAEWPEPPPFDINPTLASSAFYAIPTPISVSSTQQSGSVISPKTLYHEVNEYPGIVSQAISQNHFRANIPTSFYPQLHPDLPVAYPQSFSVPYTPPHTDQQGLWLSKSSGGTLSRTSTGIMSNVLTYSGQEDNMPNYLQAYPSTNLHVHRPQVYSQNLFKQSIHLYQAQKEEMAKQAREIWFATSGIKDFPQSLRIFVVIQHVVARFEQKYTNEPGLSMFIDGLDHSALMRPVRSLNGLACKTCVASANRNITSSYPSTNQPPSDRKLYTLPHLLNHFKSAHLEKSPVTVEWQTGMEFARLDWKKDMIELPEHVLIAGLVNAQGMTNDKLHLIAAVLPGVFPDPLPALGSAKISGPVPKPVSSDYDGQTHANPYLSPTDRVLRQSETSNRSSKPDPPAAPYSMDQFRESPPYTLGSEIAADDEYDPHRPTFLGRIVQHPQISHILERPNNELPLEDLGRNARTGLTIGIVTEKQLDLGRASEPHGSHIVRHPNDLILRRNHKNYALSHVNEAQDNRERRNIHSQITNSTSEVVAADNFLRDFRREISNSGQDNSILAGNDPVGQSLQSLPDSRVVFEHQTSKIENLRCHPQGNVASKSSTTSDHHLRNKDVSAEENLPSTHRIQYVYTDYTDDRGSHSEPSPNGERHWDLNRMYDHNEHTYPNKPSIKKDNHRDYFSETSSQKSNLTSRKPISYEYEALMARDEGSLHTIHMSNSRPAFETSYSPQRYGTVKHELDSKPRPFEYVPVSPEPQPQYVLRYDTQCEDRLGLVYRGTKSSQQTSLRGAERSYNLGAALETHDSEIGPSIRQPYCLFD